LFVDVHPLGCLARVEERNQRTGSDATSPVICPLECLAKDLEAFAEHAGRTGILADDVKLVCRKNPKLFAELSKVLEQATGPSAHKKQKK